MLAGIESLADHKSFFNSKDGKYNPQKELDATLASFFEPGVEETPETQHPQCRFPARFDWLDQKLGFDFTKLAKQKCPRFDAWYKALNPEQITIVFPSTYMNDPASMFGHTLLRIDAHGQTEKTRLLAYSANYSAKTDASNAMLYALKGLVGLYQGYFSISPFYETVETYNALERRDIWEYELNYSQAEVDFLLKHLWEMQGVAFDYFYFDENCSYHLLALLDVIRPELELSKKFRFWAIPVDTIRSVSEVPGLVKKINYRPSIVTKLEARMDLLSDEQKKAVLDIQDKPSLDREDIFDSKTLEASFDYLQLRQVEGEFESEQVSDIYYSLLKKRSELGQSSSHFKVKPPSIRPEQGHLSTRSHIGAGSKDDKLFIELSWRAAYHDLIDKRQGFKKGAEIEFFDLRLRQYEEDGIELERLNLVSVRALSPKTNLTKPKAWAMGAEIDKKQFSKEKDSGVFEAQALRGVAFSLLESSRLYFLVGANAQISGHFDDNYALGLESKNGLVQNLGEDNSFELFLNGSRHFLGDNFNTYGLGLNYNYSLSTNKALRANFSRKQDYEYEYNEFGLNFIAFF